MNRGSMRVVRRLITMILSILILGAATTAFADGINAGAFSGLRTMFPDGKYWNHVGTSFDDYVANQEAYNASYTEYPCDNGISKAGTHNHGKCAPYDGHCGCNSYDDAIQCMGFAYYVGHYLTGTDVEEWDTVTTSLTADWMRGNLQAGDYIRFGTNDNGHSSIVVSVDSTGAKLLECNYTFMNSGSNCKIAWTDTISFATLAGRKTGGYVKRCPISISITSDIPEVYVNQTNGFLYTVNGLEDRSLVKFTSEDPNVLQVDNNGCVRGISAGACEVYAYIEYEGFTYESQRKWVRVIEGEVDLDPYYAELKFGEKVQLTPVKTGIDEHFTEKWSSSDTSVATVDDSGTVKAISEGICDIKVEYTGDVCGQYEAIATIVVASDFAIATAQSELYPGEKVKLKAVNQKGTVQWTSSNTEVATIDKKGNVTAKGCGTTTIIAKNGDKSSSCEITVLTPEISLSPESIVLYMECKESITVAIKGKSKKASWKSSDSKIVSVNGKGKITAKKAGTAVITATANNVSASCTITVLPPSLSISPTALSLTIGETHQLMTEAKGKTQTVTYKSSNTKIVSVSKSGEVKALKAGRATITARANGLAVTCSVVVNKAQIEAVIAAYQRKLEQEYLQKKNYRFGLVYLDDDDLPELVVEPEMASHADTSYCYTYHNGQVVQLKYAGAEYGYFYYCPRSGVAFNYSWVNRYGEVMNYYSYKSIEPKQLAHFEDGTDWKTGKSVYIFNKSKVLKATYDKKLKEYKKKYPMTTVSPNNLYPVSSLTIADLGDSYLDYLAR